MVRIRMSRGGTNKRPFYHIVVADKRKARDGSKIERVGYFNPLAKSNEIRLFINEERMKYWLSVGAQPSERVAFLLTQPRAQQQQEQA